MRVGGARFTGTAKIGSSCAGFVRSLQVDVGGGLGALTGCQRRRPSVASVGSVVVSLSEIRIVGGGDRASASDRTRSVPMHDAGQDDAESGATHERVHAPYSVDARGACLG